MNKVTKYAIVLMIITILSKILGFTREIVLGSTYGASELSDVYITAMNIPNVIFTILGTTISTTFIPLYYENYNEGGEKKAVKYTNNMINILMTICIIMTVISFIFSDTLVKIFAIGFENEKFDIAVKFTKVMIFCGPAIIMNYIMSAYLQAKENFIAPGLISVPFSIIIIISIILSIKINIYILPIGTVLAMVSQFLFQLPFAIKNGYRYERIFKLDDKYIKKAIWLVGPIFIGVAVNQVNTMIDRTLASTLVDGSISALNYANRLNGFVFGLVITSISTVIYPMLSKISQENNREEFIDILTKSVNSIVLLIIPISIGAITLAEPIVKLLFQRGVFDQTATNMTSSALICYSIGMIGFGLTDILGKVFYSLQDTKTPMINGIVSMIINIILNITLVKSMGHSGLALATSISSIIGILLLFKSLKRKVDSFGQYEIISVVIKSLVASLIMGAIVIYMKNRLDYFFGINFISEILSLLISIGIGIVSYSIVIILLKVKEVNIIINFIKEKFFNNKNITDCNTHLT